MNYLNVENIARSGDGVEYHPLVPFLPSNAKVLFLGSFPPQRKRWCMDFFYPNFINDHWRIEGEVFFGDRQHFVVSDKKVFNLDEIVDFCNAKGIAFFDTACAVRRLKENASDKFLEVVVTTGEKATDTLCQYYGVENSPKVGMFSPLSGIRNQQAEQIYLYRLPSSSRAYPLAFEKKVAFYREMFRFAGVID